MLNISTEDIVFQMEHSSVCDDAYTKVFHSFSYQTYSKQWAYLWEHYINEFGQQAIHVSFIRTVQTSKNDIVYNVSLVINIH